MMAGLGTDCEPLGAWATAWGEGSGPPKPVLT